MILDKKTVERYELMSTAEMKYNLGQNLKRIYDKAYRVGVDVRVVNPGNLIRVNKAIRAHGGMLLLQIEVYNTGVLIYRERLQNIKKYG